MAFPTTSPAAAVASAVRSFTRVADLDAEELIALLDLAAEMRANPLARRPTLEGRSLACYFAEPSTRTRASVEAAAWRLGMLPIVLRPDELQLGRGEPLADTARVLSAMRRHCRPHVRAVRRGRARPGGVGPGDQRADRQAPPLPGARRPPHDT